MRYNRAILLLIPAISAIILITDNSIAFAYSPQSQSQISIVECTNGSCYRLSCTNGQPCQTFPSNQPSLVQPSQEVTTTTVQPLEETPTMRSADQAATVTQPNDVTTTYQFVEVPVEICGDGLDNDDDSEVDEQCRATTFSSYQYVEVPVEICGDGLDNDDDSEVDEQCRATTFSSTSPTILIDEDHKQQLSTDGLEQPSEENGHSDDESNGDSEEKEHEDEDED
jgi:hypothetical protein